MSTSSVHQVACPSRYETHLCFEFIFEEPLCPLWLWTNLTTELSSERAMPAVALR